MSCPYCGAIEQCLCSASEFQPRHVRRPRFQPDQPVRSLASSVLDPEVAAENVESSDTTERHFAVTLPAPATPPRRPRFILNDRSEPRARTEELAAPAATPVPDHTDPPPNPPPPGAISQAHEKGLVLPPAGDQSDGTDLKPPSLACDDADRTETFAVTSSSVHMDDQAWREEIAQRLHSYRIRRRRRAPRYPSLSLKFETPEPRYSAFKAAEPVTPGISLDTTAPETTRPAPYSYASAAPWPRPANIEPKIIEFPKPVPPPLPILDVPVVDELAEPVIEGPRILDAPETLPQIAPLAGITLEQPAELPPGLELPLQVAPVLSRFTAAAIDCAFVLLAAALFATIVFKTTTGMSARVLVEVTLGVSAVLWTVYEYFLITYAGSTPGMEAAQIRLSCFDGALPGKRCRRGRALAMILSAVSFFLGYLWCLFDEDTLCWHDRITRTYTIRGCRGGIFGVSGAFLAGLLRKPSDL